MKNEESCKGDTGDDGVGVEERNDKGEQQVVRQRQQKDEEFGERSR